MDFLESGLSCKILAHGMGRGPHLFETVFNISR